ncbi:DNA/RNA helicase domain-containing protein [Polluticoccus soli]|uniref:DNA/RNA helicase domain-containing protein n=1 Tax=Polluticoccus soli TaxID=3034150 RepID=UPI0023E31586|nr:DNA/RNA helicase domain-containing protein [Flavipsychrobacter sp. JY13-12]
MGAFYLNSIGGFLKHDDNAIIGKLTKQGANSGFHQQLHSQTDSWDIAVPILKANFKQLISDVDRAKDWTILLEYPIVRRDKRIDIVLIADSIIIVIEFKASKPNYSGGGEHQLLDYCLDLRDFHFESRDKIIVPILLIPNTRARKIDLQFSSDFVQQTLFANDKNLNDLLRQIASISHKRGRINANSWNQSSYAPTPTIIEAARVLFAGHSVENITKSHAGATNLTKTTDAIVSAINKARKNREKLICFITGVPGAGKTLAGLHIAHHSDFQAKDVSLATFLSGNGPLIKVLRSALARDAKTRLAKEDKAVKEKEQERIIAFIENVHRFIDGYFENKKAKPNNQIVIFDEAQRAWNAKQSMRKFKRDFSEPDLMLEIMDRHKDWAVIVALIGGGQEINTGEAGLREWGNKLKTKYKHWRVYVSPQLEAGDHSTGDLTLFETKVKHVDVTRVKDLHLDVSLRSYKAEKLSEWVQQLLNNRPQAAATLFATYLHNYPIAITRDLDAAREWLKERDKGTRRVGLVASSGGRRLRKQGLDVKGEFDAASWFLNDREDVRSSYALEVPATEFGIQGLELDWTGVCWDLDLRRHKDDWDFKLFKGTKWTNVKGVEMQRFITNKYRVLLTRAREGMVIYVPVGDEHDKTAPRKEYDAIYSYMISCGVPEL